MTPRSFIRGLAATLVTATITLSIPAFARVESPTPAWLALAPGTLARVDIAPWLDSDEPEAALTESATSISRDFTTHAERPADVVFQPIGVRVRIARVLPGGQIAYVRGRDRAFGGYTLVSRLLPEVPPGTALHAAGGFQGYADFFPTVATPYKRALRLATRSALVAIETGAGPFDPDTADLVRVRVRVLSGDLRGRTGWVAVAYTGIPRSRLPQTAAVVERACGCRLLAFGSSLEAPI